MDQYGGMIDQFSVYMNTLALNNKKHLNLKNYETKDSLKPIDMSFINSIIAQRQNCSYNFMTLMKFMYEHTKCIDANYIIDKLNKNLEEIYRKFNNRTHILHISNIYSRDKSNFFFILYFILHYNLKFKKPIYVYSNEFNKTYIDTVYTDKPVLFIICDDFSYSGNQLDIEITNINKVTLMYNNKIIYLNVFGYTLTAIKKINKNINILFPKHLKPFGNSLINILIKFIKYKKISIADFIRTYDMFIFENNEIQSLLYNRIFSIPIPDADVYLIYLFYKFPDFVSTYLNLCTLPIFDNTIKIINTTHKKINVNTKINDINMSTYKNILQQLNDQLNNEKDFIQCNNNNNMKKGVYFLKGFKILLTLVDNNNNNILTPLNLELCNKILKPFYKKNIYNKDIPLSLYNDMKYTFENLYYQHIPIFHQSHA